MNPGDLVTWYDTRTGGKRVGTLLAVEPHRKRPDTARIVGGSGSREYGPPGRYRIPLQDVRPYVRALGWLERERATVAGSE